MDGGGEARCYLVDTSAMLVGDVEGKEEEIRSENCVFFPVPFFLQIRRNFCTTSKKDDSVLGMYCMPNHQRTFNKLPTELR